MAGSRRPEQQTMIIITIVQIHLCIKGIFGLKEILGNVCIVLMKQLQTN